MGIPTAEEKEPKPLDILLEHLKSKGIEIPRCGCCGRRKWQLGHPIAAPVFVDGVLEVGRSMPMLPMTCDYCYSVQLFSWLLVKGDAK